jgi:RNA recognition motif-containing protein
VGKKLYVGNVSFQASEEDLKDFFTKIGEVESLKIITDTYTGQSKGFGFIEMASEEDAKNAIDTLNGSTFMERKIIVNEARPQRQREDRGFSRGKGGYRGGRKTGPGRGRR